MVLEEVYRNERDKTMQDTSHLTALHTGLMNAKARLAAAKNEGEIALRKVWVSQLEKEIASECKFLGMANISIVDEELSVDELLAELLA